jgi:hypothetical protein
VQASRHRQLFKAAARCRFANARPDPDFRYRSNRSASRSVGNSIATSIDQGDARACGRLGLHCANAVIRQDRSRCPRNGVRDPTRCEGYTRIVGRFRACSTIACRRRGSALRKRFACKLSSEAVAVGGPPSARHLAVAAPEFSARRRRMAGRQGVLAIVWRLLAVRRHLLRSLSDSAN